MAKFAWVEQKNYLDPTKEDAVIEFRANLRDVGYTSHFPLDPAGFVKGELLRAPDVKDPGVTTAYDFTDDDYRLRRMRVDPKIKEVLPLPTAPPPKRNRQSPWRRFEH